MTPLGLTAAALATDALIINSVFGFKIFGMLLSTLGASLLGNLLADKGTIRAGEGTIRAGQDF